MIQPIYIAWMLIETLFIIAPKMETTQKPLNIRMTKEIVIYSHTGILCSNKKEQTITKHENMNVSHRYIPMYTYIVYIQIQWIKEAR